MKRVGVGGFLHESNTFLGVPTTYEQFAVTSLTTGREMLERWRDSHQRAQALDKYIERSQREELDALQRRDQAEVDERAARLGTRG